MPYTIAIHPDNYTNKDTPEKYDASSPIWAEAIKHAGHQVKWVDVESTDILEQLKGCDGFMWRWAHFGGMSRIARRLLRIVEEELGLAVYPSQSTCWHYDDKIAQFYLLKALDIAIPATWVFFDKAEALEWADNINYPVVLKLATGAGATNVKLINNKSRCKQWIKILFKYRLSSLNEVTPGKIKLFKRIKTAAKALLRGDGVLPVDNGYELNTGYAYFQDFLPDNDFDTRITVIGDRAFGFRRINRTDDFRASGSGEINWDPSKIDKRFVHLAFDTADKLDSQSCAIDGLYDGDKPVVGEISYTYASWAVHKCPGHWKREDSGNIVWKEGRMKPEQAQIDDFLKLVEEKK